MQAKLVIAIGGGQVLRQEFDASRLLGSGSDVRFLLFNAVRHKAGSILTSSIYELEGVELAEMPAEKFGAKQHPWTATTKLQRPRPLFVSIMLLNFYGIGQVRQTFGVKLFVQVHWEVRDGDLQNWEPYLEWCNSNTVDESDIFHKSLEGYRVRSSHV